MDHFGSSKVNRKDLSTSDSILWWYIISIMHFYEHARKNLIIIYDIVIYSDSVKHIFPILQISFPLL